MTFCLDQAITNYYLQVQVHCQHQGPIKEINYHQNFINFKINVTTVQIRLDPVHLTQPKCQGYF